MRAWLIPLAVPVAATLAIGFASATDHETVPLYTGEDLDRMFGPAPPGPSVPVDRSRPEDWQVVEQFLDREYARIDADRQHELYRREYDTYPTSNDDSRMYGSMIWGGYPGYYGSYGYGNGWSSRYPSRVGNVARNSVRNGGFHGHRPISPSHAIAHGAGRAVGHGGGHR
jgi:hypothetical protein